MTNAQTIEIEQLMAALDRKIAKGNAAQSRDSAYTVYLKLQTLSEQFLALAIPELTKAEVEKCLTEARQKAWRLYETFHLEVQHDLEWASSRRYEDD